jgi:hypothetical protein
MADPVKKAINKIRHKFKRSEKPEHPLVKIIAERKAEEHVQALWERDKKIVREYNFEKAKVARAQQVEEIHAEKERQEQIAEDRLKNLKKARRRLNFLRKKEKDDA